jgi:hypothetical protein
MILIDCLPLEVIREHIMPCLDWFGCLHINMLLKPHERIVRQIQPVKLKQVEILINQNKIKTALNNVNDFDFITVKREEVETNRIWSILELFETVKQNLAIVQYSAGFRKALLDKIDTVINETPETWSKMPEEFHLRFAQLFPALKNTIIERFPYLYQLKLSNKEIDWSVI